MTERRTAVLAGVALALAALTFAAYGAALGFEFVAFDDPDYVTENPRVLSGLSRANVAWAFTTGHASNWHPLTWLSHMLDAELFGTGAAGPHATNVLLHAANALLVFFGLLRVVDREAIARSAAVAALFALHPLHVESVAWVSERKDVLSTFFFLLAIGAYAGFARRGGGARFAVTAILFGLGLLAKPMVVTLPFVFLLLDYWPLERLPRTPARRLVIEKLPFFAMSLASAAATFAVQAATGAVKNVEVFPLGARVGNAIVSYAAYLADAVAPAGLGAFYPHPALPGGAGIGAGEVALAALVLAALTAIALVAAARFGRRYALAGWLFYLGTLVPVIGLVQVGLQARADRYTYVPLLGVFVAAAWGAADLARRAGPRARVAGAVAVAGASVAMAVATRAQAATWRDSVALFERALAVTENNYPTRYNLAHVHASAGRVDEAIAEYRRALAIHPGDPGSNNNLGSILRERGAADLAAGRVEEGRRLIAEARSHFEAALAGRPANARALANLGHCEAQLGNPDAAIERYERALAIDPGLAAARNALIPTLGERAFALATSKDGAARDGARALALATRACELTGFREPGLVDVRAAAFAELGRFEEAVQAATRAVALAEAARAPREAALFRTRLTLYQSRRPLRE